jgi:predicted O-methyltransferase YrrM
MDKETFLALVEKTKKVDERPEEIKRLIRRPNSFHYYKLFVHLAKAVDPKLIVELGTNQGVGAVHFRHGSETARIVTVDIKSSPKVERRLEKHNIEGIVCDSVEAAPMIEDGTVDIIFFDANHTYDSLMPEVVAWVPKMAPGSIMLFDDIHYDIEKRKVGYISIHNKPVAVGEETGMSRAWKEIRQTVTGKHIECKYLHPSVSFGVILRP